MKWTALGAGARTVAAACTLSALLTAVRAHAELPAEGARIRTPEYAIDLSQTAVLAGNRVTGLGGAFVAIAEGVDGTAQNPAAVAHRAPWSTDHFDYDLGLGITFSSQIPNADLFNSGRRVLVARGAEERFVFLNLAANLQFGRWGFGVASDIQEYSLRRTTMAVAAEQRDRLAARFIVTHITGGYAFHRGELLFGVGSRIGVLNVVNANSPEGDEQALFTAVGSGFHAGVLVRPNDARYRIGVSFRSPVTAAASRDGPVPIVYAGDPENELFLPNRVTLPWDLHAGIAVQLGPRPFNPRWLDPVGELRHIEQYLAWRTRERERLRRAVKKEATQSGADVAWTLRALDAELQTQELLDALHLERAERELALRLRERYRGMERFYLLLTGSIEVLGRVDDAIGVESFLDRTVQRSGTRPSVSPRLGVETEAVPNWTRIRAGGYVEPTRFESNPNGARVHGTLGLDQRLFPWEVFGLLEEGSIFRVTGSVDVARDYFSWGIALGMWH